MHLLILLSYPVVRIRDNNMKTMPGVTIEDMGYKMGLNGVDNAKLAFDHVRVPREALLNRWSDVAEERSLLVAVYFLKFNSSSCTCCILLQGLSH